jgi:hypothetical protein
MLAAIRSWSDRRCAANAAEFARRWSGVIAIPDYFLQLLILIEDKRFPKHYGVDPIGVVRAIVHNVLKRGMRQGASTLLRFYCREAGSGGLRDLDHLSPFKRDYLVRISARCLLG